MFRLLSLSRKELKVLRAKLLLSGALLRIGSNGYIEQIACRKE
jgi:hypothetical protein